MKFSNVLVMMAFAAIASAQGQYSKVTVYSRAARQAHLDPYYGSAIHYNTHVDGTSDYYCDASSDDYFTVTGSSVQANLPWGTTWQSLCDNHWVTSAHVSGNGLSSGQSVTIMQDYYIIDHNYVDPSNGVADKGNGDDDIKNGPEAPPPYCYASWSRTCVSWVTNSFYAKVTG